MWLLFLILLQVYLLVRIIKITLEILDHFEMKKSAKEMAKVWKESIENGCQEAQKETQPTSHGRHAL